MNKKKSVKWAKLLLKLHGENTTSLVRGWFRSAKEEDRVVGINLYFKPNQVVFYKLAKLVIKGAGIWLYEGDLYETYAGSGDSEECMIYLGSAKEMIGLSVKELSKILKEKNK